MLFFEIFTSFQRTTAVPHSRVEHPRGILFCCKIQNDIEKVLKKTKTHMIDR